MHNLLASTSNNKTLITGLKLPVSKVVSRLDALLFVLKSCHGASCRNPWAQLHTAGDVNSLAEALHARFDGFYDSVMRVRFESCANGFLVEAEGPVWEEGTGYFRDGVSWDVWV